MPPGFPEAGVDYDSTALPLRYVSAERGGIIAPDKSSVKCHEAPEARLREIEFGVIPRP